MRSFMNHAFKTRTLMTTAYNVISENIILEISGHRKSSKQTDSSHSIHDTVNDFPSHDFAHSHRQGAAPSSPTHPSPAASAAAAREVVKSPSSTPPPPTNPIHRFHSTMTTESSARQKADDTQTRRRQNPYKALYTRMRWEGVKGAKARGEAGVDSRPMLRIEYSAGEEFIYLPLENYKMNELEGGKGRKDGRTEWTTCYGTLRYVAGDRVFTWQTDRAVKVSRRWRRAIERE